MNNSFDFDLKSLQVFIHTVDLGNMTASAETLGTTQSAISQNLSNLEQSLNIKLLDRSVRPLTVTTAGRYFYDNALKTIAQARKTNSDIKKANFVDLQHVNIAIVDSLVTAIGPLLISVLKKHTATWKINTGLSHLHGEALVTKKVDMLLSDNAMEDHHNLQRQVILREPFILVLPKDKLGNCRLLQQQLTELDFIRYAEGSLIGVKIERYLKRASITPKVSMRFDNTFAILSAVALGLGWTISTPLCLFNNGIDLNKLACFPLLEEPLYRNLTLVCRGNEQWKLPSIIADSCKKSLKNEFTVYVENNFSWIRSEIKIG